MKTILKWVARWPAAIKLAAIVALLVVFGAGAQTVVTIEQPKATGQVSTKPDANKIKKDVPKPVGTPTPAPSDNTGSKPLSDQAIPSSNVSLVKTAATTTTATATSPAPAKTTTAAPNPTPLPDKRVNSITLTANIPLVPLGCGISMSYQYGYRFDFNYGRNDITLNPVWEYEPIGLGLQSRSITVDIKPILQGYKIAGNAVAIYDNASPARVLPSNNSSAYRVRLHVTSPNDVYSNWVTVPGEIPCI